MRRVAQYNSPIGPLLLAAEGDFLTEVRFHCPELPAVVEADPVLSAAAMWLDGYFGKNPPPVDTLPLRPAGRERPALGIARGVLQRAHRRFGAQR